MIKKLLLLVSLVLLVSGNFILYHQDSCENGNGKSCWYVGDAYEYGKSGVRQDYTKAKYYCEKGCELNEGFSCGLLGILYERGKGVRQNKSKAKYYFRKSCNLKVQLGCKDYHRLNSQGY